MHCTGVALAAVEEPDEAREGPSCQAAEAQVLLPSALTCWRAHGSTTMCSCEAALALVSVRHVGKPSTAQQVASFS